tara:strand:+ start:262 stop:927 length:666 start_codon:yes stop_codon:yes gene_type:complete
MKQRIKLIIGIILLICVSQLQAQETINFKLLINDHNDKPLTGMFRIETSVEVDGYDVKNYKDILVFNGAAFFPMELEIQEGETGNILVGFYPAEDPYNREMSTPILDDELFRLEGSLDFVLGDNNELIFKIFFDYYPQEVISTNKLGAEREAARSSEWYKNIKKGLEVGVDIPFFNASGSLEADEGKSGTETLVDREMSENVLGKRWTVNIPNGGLKIVQK